MALNRLSFLYPRVLRATRNAGRSPYTASHASPHAATGLPRSRGTFARRRGKAVEPLPQHTENPKPLVEPVVIGGAMDGMKPRTQSPASASQATHAATSTAQSQAEPASQNRSNSSSAAASPAPASQPASDPSTPLSEPAQARPSDNESPEEKTRIAKEAARQSGPLEKVLHMGPPENAAPTTPSMSPPPYVHHFNSFSLVKQLQQGGYSQDQSITAMKGVRTLLKKNLDIAQSSLVSKSDVENETYLFTAACSELSTEIKNNRRLEEEQLRQQRTHLQHEVDNLTQSLNQELHTLNDNVRGMFNDRKMAVREEQKGAESAVQQINYKISISLSSDAKSEIEAVRWILIRRSVLGILIMAMLTLGTIRYATYMSHERQREAERLKREEEERRRNPGRHDHSSDINAAAILAAN